MLKTSTLFVKLDKFMAIKISLWQKNDYFETILKSRFDAKVLRKFTTIFDHISFDNHYKALKWIEELKLS